VISDDRRIAFPALLTSRGLLDRGVEVGVQRGEFSKAVLARWPGREYHMVDAWKTWPEEEYPDPTNREHPEMNFQAALGVAKLHWSRVVIHRMTSEEAAALPIYADGSLDWVYIDANHTYKYVRQDILLWLPKVRSGGILAGHDYVDGPARGRPDIEVKRAVDELLGREYEIHRMEPEWPSFWVEV